MGIRPSTDALADRVAFEVSRHAFADDDHFRCGGRVSLVEIPAGNERDAKCSEISRRHIVERHPDTPILRKRLVANLPDGRHKVVSVAHGPDCRGSDGLRARNIPDLFENTPIRVRHILAAPAGQTGIDREHQDVVPVITRIQCPNIDKRAEKQPRRDEQAER